jgi:hypothetical protein
VQELKYSGYTTVPSGMWRLGKTATPSATVLLMYLYFCRESNIKTSRRSLSRASGFGLSTVNKGLLRLQSLGFITRETHKDEDGCHRPTTYIIHEEAVVAACQEQE